MDDYVRANTTNLPMMTSVMILEFISSSDLHNIAEIRGAKLLMSSRDSYVDSGVGYVEVKRDLNECTVRCKVVPEHKVTSKQYIVWARINEMQHVVVESKCESCAASAGGCKHSLLFLFWLEKRSSEPSPTTIECYWKKPRLSNVKTKPILSEKIFKNATKIALSPPDSNVLKNFLAECSKHQISNSLVTCFANIKKSYNLFDMTIEYLEHSDDEDFEKYKAFINSQFTERVKEEINRATMEQADSKTWHAVRQGRITGSKLHEASRCNTVDGSLVQHILGGYKVPETQAMKRGKSLEKYVLMEIEAKLGKEIKKCGFLMINGLCGASPDGVGDDFVLEIKCPSKPETVSNFVCNNKIKDKFVAQMQAEMHAAGKKKALFCLADPSFEQNKNVTFYWIDYDEKFTLQLLRLAEKFWEQYIFKHILTSAALK